MSVEDVRLVANNGRNRGDAAEEEEEEGSTLDRALAFALFDLTSM